MVTDVHAADTVAVHLVERRRGRPRHVPMPLDAMRRTEGRPITPRDMAALSGMSIDKVHDLLTHGYIEGTKIFGGRTRRRFHWTIPYAEAQRYLRELRLLE
jgi:hypothetical protein